MNFHPALDKKPVYGKIIALFKMGKKNIPNGCDEKNRMRAFQREAVCCKALCVIPAAASEPLRETGAHAGVNGA